MATFVGASQGGFLGALLATLGVVLPSFVIILLIATLLAHLLRYAGVKAVLRGIRPAIIGMLLATAVAMLLNAVCGLKTVESYFSFDWRALVIFLAVVALSLGYFKWKKKPISPIVLIVLSGGMGVLAFGV